MACIHGSAFCCPFFSCSLDMYTFDEATPGGFGFHVAHEHSPLQYVFFLHHLRKCKIDEYNGEPGCWLVANRLASKPMHRVGLCSSSGGWRAQLLGGGWLFWKE